MTHWVFRGSWLFLCLFWGTGLQAQVPIPEDFLPSGRVGEYVKAATSFLKNSPQDRFAPRVTFDLYTLFASIGKTAEAEQLRGKLLLDYPLSFQAGYLITTFEDASKFAKFLDGLIDKLYEKDPAGLPKSFCRLYSVGLTRFRGHHDLSEDLSLLLKGYLFSQVAKESDLEKQIRKNLALKQIEVDDPTEQELLEVSLSRTLSVEERILRLHAIEGEKLANFLKRVYLETLDEKTANLPSIQRVKIQNRLEDKQFSEALVLINALPVEAKKAQDIRFWQGLSYYGLGQDAEALKVFGEIYNENPQGAWAETVKGFGEGLLAFTTSIEQQSVLIHQFIQALLTETEVFQVRLVYEGENGRHPTPLHVYVGVLPKQNFMEITFTKGNELILAYRTTNVDSTLFFKDESVIHHFPKPGPILSPTMNVEKSEDGGFTFSAEASMESSFSAAKKKSQLLLDTPILNTQKGIQELLIHTYRKHGICPLPYSKVGDSFIYSGLLPEYQKPGLEKYALVQNAKGRLVNMQFPGIKLTDLQYGTAAKVQLTPPVWPEKSVQNHQQLDIPLFLRVFAVLAEIIK